MLLNKQRHANWQKRINISFLLPIFLLLTSVIAGISFISPAEAATSSTLSFQGRLLSDTGALVLDGDYNVEFNLYTVASGGSTEWTETHTVQSGNPISVANGYFSVDLGDATEGNPFPASIDWDQELWLGMTVRGTGNCAFAACTPNDSEMTPRFKLTAVPYAFRAGAVVDSAGTAFTGDDLIQAAPDTIQAINSLNAAIRYNQAGGGGLIEIQQGGNDVFTVANDGDTQIAGDLTLGTATEAGNLTLQDGSGNGLTLQQGSQTGSLTFTLPGNYGVADQCLKTDGAGGLTFENCPGGSVSVVKTVDESVTNSNLLQTDDELTFNVEANEVWTVEFEIQATSNTTADYRYAVAAPAGSTCFVAVENIENAQSAAQSPCGTNPGNTSAQNATDSFRVKATINVGGTDGAVTLLWAQNTPNASPTTVRAGSYLVAREEGLGGGGGGGGGANSFVQNGNDFGTTAVLGTTGSDGLNLITNNTVRLAITSTGDATFNQSLTVGNGLTVSSGDIDFGSGDITSVGDISSVGDITGSAGLTLSSGGAGDLTLSSASDVLLLDTKTLRRNDTGTLTLDLLDSSAGTTFAILNSDITEVAGLTVEGDISAAAISGDGSGLTDLDGSQITTGTIPNDRLTTEVALTSSSQTFTGLPTFNAGIVLGDSTSTTAGAVRWSGTDFEGFNGISWVSLTTDSSLPLLEGVLAFGKVDSTGTALSIDGASVVRNAVGDYTVTLDTAAATANYIVQLTVEETAANLDDINISIDNQTVNGFDVDIREGDNGTTADVRIDKDWHFIVFDDAASVGGGGGGGTSFVDGGNSFGGNAVLGTTDTFGLSIITDNSAAITISSAGLATFTQAAQFNDTLTIGSLGTPDALAQLALSTGATTNKGLVIQGEVSQTANLLEIQNSSGTVRAAFNSNGELVLGTASSANGEIIFNNDTNSNTVTLDSEAVTGARVVSLPDASGTICLSGSDTCGFLPLATGSFVTDSTTNDTIAINKTGASGNLIALRKNNTPVFTVANTGALQIQDTSTAALDIRNVGGASYLTVDTSTGVTTVDTLSITNGISGAGLADCDGNNDVLQWDSTSGLFSCRDATVAMIQAYDGTGGTNLNAATLTAVPFDNETRKMTGFTHDNVTNNSRVQLDDPGWYRLDYNVATINGGNGRITLRCEARLNGTTSILQSASYSYNRNSTDNNASNFAGFVFETTSDDEYVEILCQQAGSAGTTNTIANETWVLVEKR